LLGLLTLSTPSPATIGREKKIADRVCRRDKTLGLLTSAAATVPTSHWLRLQAPRCPFKKRAPLEQHPVGAVSHGWRICDSFLCPDVSIPDIRTLPDHVESRDRKGIAQNQRGGACPPETSDISDVSISKKSSNFFGTCSSKCAAISMCPFGAAGVGRSRQTRSCAVADSGFCRHRGPLQEFLRPLRDALAGSRWLGPAFRGRNRTGRVPSNVRPRLRSGPRRLNKIALASRCSEDRREGRQPRSLRRLPDGQRRHLLNPFAGILHRLAKSWRKC
jgi:hypothetical protein